MVIINNNNKLPIFLIFLSLKDYFYYILYDLWVNLAIHVTLYLKLLLILHRIVKLIFSFKFASRCESKGKKTNHNLGAKSARLTALDPVP
jgi:hypothetical protein